MSDENENENITEDTGKQAAVQSEVSAPASSPTPVEQVPPISQSAAEPRMPEFGDHVLYVEENRVLNATVQVAFTNGAANLRVLDPDSQLGYFDVTGVKHHAGETIGTFHYRFRR